jgi:hypothetical protein
MGFEIFMREGGSQNFDTTLIRFGLPLDGDSVELDYPLSC